MQILSHDPRYKFEVREGSWSDQVVIREIFCENVYEVADGDLQDTAVVVDVGANIGAFGAFCHSLLSGENAKGNSLKVYAYEPEPHNYALLTENIKLNKLQDVVKAVQRGVSDKAAQMFITNEEGGSHVATEGDDSMAKISVITLDQVWAQNELEFVDILKVDVEGHEGQIILGARKELLMLIRYIVIEFDNRTSTPFGDLVAKLSETHQLKIVGSHEDGGTIFARRY